MKPFSSEMDFSLCSVWYVEGWNIFPMVEKIYAIFFVSYFTRAVLPPIFIFIKEVRKQTKEISLKQLFTVIHFLLRGSFSFKMFPLTKHILGIFVVYMS